MLEDVKVAVDEATMALLPVYGYQTPGEANPLPLSNPLTLSNAI